MTISVIIPTLNEAKELPETLRRARALPEVIEIIVVDGGSRDETLEIARRFQCSVHTCLPSRGRQMRLGVNLAQGDIVLLLHADTWLPEDAPRAIASALGDPAVVAGAFYKRFRDDGALPGSRLRCWLLWALARRFFGDQAIFVRRASLEAIGGVPDVPLMEEFELCKQLEAHGRLALVAAIVLTSARRFRDDGRLRAYWQMARCLLAYGLGDRSSISH